MKKLSTEELTELENQCTEIARDNWDGSVMIVATGEETQTLRFTSFSEDNELEAVWVAIQVRESHPSGIYAFRTPQELDGGRTEVFMSLCPKAIVGLLGL